MLLVNPAMKYRPFPAINLPLRQWLGMAQQQAPRWCSSDLRDGNPAPLVACHVGHHDAILKRISCTSSSYQTA